MVLRALMGDLQCTEAVAELDGRTLIDRAIHDLSACVETVAVCGREIPGMLSLPDRPRADRGQ